MLWRRDFSEAGRLRWKVAVQEPVDEPDEIGGTRTRWVTRATVRANIKPLRGRDLTQAQVTTPEITHLVEIRYRPWVGSHHRLLLKKPREPQRILNVLTVVDVGERRTKLELHCKELREEGVHA